MIEAGALSFPRRHAHDVFSGNLVAGLTHAANADLKP
jgi:hypothetical protein